MTFERLFQAGMDRELPKLLDPPEGLSIGLGESGTKRHGRDMSLGLPSWRFPADPIPCARGSVAIIHAYHFIEHLHGETAIMLLREVERVLMPGGIFQFCMPHFSSELAHEDLTHKSFWTESSFKTLMNNPYYNPGNDGGKPWMLRQHYLVVAGVVHRNMSIFGQLVRI